MNKLFEQYLSVLELTKQPPTFEYLSQLITAHLTKIPFENISKIFYYIKYDLKYIPDFELYLDGIEKFNFGGTCYSNNYYFNQLLNFLGFKAMLCGADMNNPDVHLVNVINWGSKNYLVDVGYAAPFYYPIPLYQSFDFDINFGNETFVLKPKNNDGNHELKQYRDNKIKHGYVVKPFERSISEFEQIIVDSFRKNSTFLNRITAVKYNSDKSISIRNYSLIEMTKTYHNIKKYADLESLELGINENFKIPRNILRESLIFYDNQIRTNS